MEIYNSESDPDTLDSSHECPFPAVHTRLQDAHNLWHQVEAAYFSPERFRANLNACIEALRSVTWVLQNNKAKVPDFENWYAGWQDKLRQDPILRWLVQARNCIVKEGDLETHSIVRVSVTASYLDLPYREYRVKPHESTEVITRRIQVEGLPSQIMDDGFLRVERRWIAANLPEHELLDALAHTYGVLATCLDDAHRQVGLPVSTTHVSLNEKDFLPVSGSTDHLHGRLPCMIAIHETRTVWFKLKTGEVVYIDKLSQGPISLHELENAAQRYQLGQGVRHPETKPSSLRERATYFLEVAKRMLLKDGYHISIALLELPDGRMTPYQINARDQADKYVMWRTVAADVERTGANAVICISEAWYAPFDPGKPFQHARESPDRKEAINLVAASEEGEEISLVSLFERADDEIKIGETYEDSTSVPFFIGPIKRVWRKRKERTQRQ